MSAGGRHNADSLLATRLAAGDRIISAAKAAKLSESTAHRRLKDPAFRGEVDRLRSEMVARTIGRIADGAGEAAEVLRKLLKSRTATIRLSAARSVLEFMIRTEELYTLVKRLDDIERRMTTRPALQLRRID